MHQSAKDFLLNKASDQSLPSGAAHQHHALFSRSLGALSETLRRDIYSLAALGFSIDKVSPPDPDPLASIGYSCVFWVDHLNASRPWVKMSDEDPQDARIIHDFLQNKYLYWLESLSLLRSMSEGVMAVQKLEAIVKTKEARQLTELLRDARRFILSHKRAIEIAPLQAYASALVFSPTRSLIRKLFQKEEPNWITSKPSMESDWNACVQTLEGHGGWVSSVVFSTDGERLASGSFDGTVKIWDAATGACVQTLNVGRALYRLSFDPTTNTLLSTDIGLLNLDHPALPPAIDDQSTEITLRGIRHSSWGISTDGVWIVKDRKEMLWLPPDYRGWEPAVVRLTAAIGCRSGRVLVMKFS